MDRDVERWDSTIQEFASFPFIEPQRIPAVLGSALPDAACHILTGNKWSHAYKGTLGCFLSHMRAWEAVLKLNSPFALVVEDNIELRNCDVLERLELPAGSDLIFCNARTAYADESSAAAESTLRTVEPIVRFIQTHQRAVGGDGYLLTPQGASKLLEYVSKDRLFTHVDLRMLAYCLQPKTEMSPENFTRAAKTVLELRKRFPAAHFLTGYSMWPPVTERRKVASTRQQVDLTSGDV